MPDTFTPEQIAQILEEFFRVVGTRQYIGARYVPIFGRKDETSIEWDNTAPYEPLTIVLYQGNSYTSRQYVPVGVEITNQEFWALTGNYNAQVEQYRREVAAFDDRITTNTNNITAANGRIDDEVLARSSADTALTNRLDATDGNLADEVLARTNADSALTNRLDTTDTNLAALQTAYNNKDKGILVLGDSYGEGYTPDGTVRSWITVFSEAITPKGYVIYSRYIGGAGFWREDSAKRFSTLAQNAVNAMNAAQKASIGTVIVGGGYNDRSNTRDAIYNGMVNLQSVIADNLPNVKRVLVFPFGMAVEGLTTGDHAAFTYQTIQDMLMNYIDANNSAHLGTIVGNANMLLRKNAYFSSDYVHPNENGQFLLGSFVNDVFLGNDNPLQIVRYNKEYYPNIVYDSGITAQAGFVMYSDESQFIIHRPNTGTITFATPVTSLVADGEASHRLQIGTFADAAMQKPALFKIPVLLTIRSSTSTPRRYTSANGWLLFDTGTLYIGVLATKSDGSNFETFESVDRIQFYTTENAKFDGVFLK